MINTYHFLNGIPTQDKTYILFARHGESEINALKRVGGASPAADLSLTEKGEDEARQLGEALSPFSNQIRTAYTSPLQRAHQTARIALKAMGSSEHIQLQIDERIQEKFMGEALDGQSEEIYHKFAAVEKEETQEMSFSQKWIYTRSDSKFGRRTP